MLSEHFLDLVNADFHQDGTVDNILNAWCSQDYGVAEQYRANEDENKTERPSFCTELSILLRRHLLLVIRDPVVYLGRCVFFLIANLIFAFGYWKARDFTQDQALNMVWVTLWLVGGTCIFDSANLRIFVGSFVCFCMF